MNTNQISKIRETIDKKKKEATKAETIIEEIEKNWEKEYGFGDIETVKKKLQELNESMEQAETKQKRLEEKLKKIIDWSLL